MRRLDFAGAGVQKGGTTALFHYLTQHPDLYLPPSKELHLFNRDPALPWSRRRAPDARIAQHFADARDSQLCGEVTPAYLYWQDGPALMAEHNPAMRVIVCLRHPVARAYSAWRMEWMRGRETLPFARAIREGRERVREAPGGQHKIFSYVERGFYGTQIATLLQAFDRAQVFFLRLEDINTRSGALDRLLQFLGVRALEFAPLTSHVFQSRGRAVGAEPLEGDFAYLQLLYTDEIARAQELSGLDLGAWMDAPDPGSLGWAA